MTLNITNPNITPVDGDPMYNNEYLMFSFEVETFLSTSILYKGLNTYVDGEKV
jgi:hypothetical protein